jgi:hypothetical protein
MESFLTGEKTDEKEKKLLRIIKEIGFGEIKVIINEGKPIRIEELKKSIKL